ncbi:hypothetical protein ACWEPA_25355 [Streptomyces filamentosus]
MAVEVAMEQDRVTGRLWTVRLAPHGHPSARAVKLSCSRPACADTRFPSAAEGRKAAIGHVNTHLAHIRAGGGPRGEARCACRAADCAWHTPDPDTGRRGGPRPPAETVRCGGPVVLTVYADRAGRLWRIAETCARCAAATPGSRVLDTAAPSSRTAPAGTGRPAEDPAGQYQRPETAAGSMTALFSHQAGSPATGAPSAAGSAGLPRARGTSASAPRQAKRRGKIAQRTVPHDLKPDALRLELIDLGDAFRAYQKDPEPDLALLAELHDRKASAFRLWADVTGDGSLRHEADRAEAAAQATREMHTNRTVQPAGETGERPAAARLLTRAQAATARAALDHLPAYCPLPGAGARLAVLMLALRAAKDGTLHITGQDLITWLPDDAEQVVERLVAAGWLDLPGTVADLMASRPENPAVVTVPPAGQPGPFAFSKTARSRISNWAQKAVSDRKLRKKKAAASTRLLALYTAAHTRPDGRLGLPEDGGLRLDMVAAFCALSPEEISEHTGLLTAAGWLAEADVAGGWLRGRLSERALPLGGLL